MVFFRAFRARFLFRFLLVAAVLCLASDSRAESAEPAAPIGDGLVLWLDAHDTDTLSPGSGGVIGCWSDKSGRGNHAQQMRPSSQPQYLADGMQGKPAIRFDGDDFLNLGRPASLDFHPGNPFTIAVVYHAARTDSGTFLSKGGGPADQRAYQFYVAPGRRGAITYGAMHEKPRSSEMEIAIEVCDGTQADVYVNGVSCLSFPVGRGSSDVDVLVGARRQNTDNTGTFYMLKGDVAEMLVYNRALNADELRQLGGYLKDKHGFEAVYTDPADMGKLVAILATPEAFAKLDTLATTVARNGEAAASEIRGLLEEHPAAALAVAELLVRIAEDDHLASPLAEIAAGLLRHDDPFVRGLAEWAIAMKVGGENNGQMARWPTPEPPSWYTEWLGLSQAFHRESDWVRQAVTKGIHRDAEKLAGSIDEMVRRAERMRVDWSGGGAGADCLALVAKHLDELRRLRTRFENQIALPLAGGSDAVAAGEGDGSTPSPALRGRPSRREGNDASGPTIIHGFEDLAGHRQLWLEARRQLRSIVLDNPAVDFEELVFVKQFAPHTVRNITRSYSWKHKPGGDICVLSNLKADAAARGVLQGRLGPGYVWGLDLWWDADRVVFGYARQPNWPPDVDTADYAVEGTNAFRLRKQHEPLHLFEVSLDGPPPRQLTDDPYWSDFEPTYCANGDIVFASDRCGRAAECGNDTYDHTNPNLYILSADGSKLRQWTDSKDIDRYPHSLDDGRIAYTHWEYQERHFMEVHAPWTARPDGTMADALFKHHMRAPCGLRDTRSVPGSSKLVSIATGHHTFAYGPVVVVDPAQGMNNEAGLRIVTPGVKPQEGPMAGRPVDDGGVVDRGGLYQTPWALSEKCFLVSYSYARPNCTAPAGADSNGFAIYLIDAYGNRELIHRDPLLSCTFPIPLRKRLRPKVVPDVRTQPNRDATCYVADVYHGLDGVPRGTVRYLRISQHIGWPFDDQRGQMDYIPGNAGSRRIDFQSWSPVRVIGTVRVEDDGSASFKVPADTAVYFQALDERHMEIRRMRSVVSLKAGEVRGCTGCHESRGWTTGDEMAIPAALGRQPERPTPPPWGSAKLLGYEWLVQPILERHCVRCHGGEDPDGGFDLTATRASDGLYQSFRTMFGRLPGEKETGRLLVCCSDRFSNADVSKPKQFGSHKSPLIRVLLDDTLHRDEVKLSDREWISLVTWVDANAPYHDTFFNKRPADGGPPRRVATPPSRIPFADTNTPSSQLLGR